MDSISIVVDEVIQNCPIDVRRPLYKVHRETELLNDIQVKFEVSHHVCLPAGLISSL